MAQGKKKTYTAATHDEDKLIGARVRLARINAGISQEQLGHACKITFQQIQKYEHGTNRISASRLHQIAKACGVIDIAWFFEDLPPLDGGGRQHSPPPSGDMLASADRAAINLHLDFIEIEDYEDRRLVTAMARRLSLRKLSTPS